MYAHVTTGHINPGQLDKFIDTLRTSNLPAGRQQPGFQGVLVLADPQSGQFMGIALFQSEADRQAFEDSGFGQKQRSKTGTLLDVTIEEPVFYEVRIVEGNIRAVEGSASS